MPHVLGLQRDDLRVALRGQLKGLWWRGLRLWPPHARVLWIEEERTGVSGRGSDPAHRHRKKEKKKKGGKKMKGGRREDGGSAALDGCWRRRILDGVASARPEAR